MAPTGDEIRANLTRFAARWGIGEWGERKEAQTFLNELFECFGMDRRDVAEFEHFEAGGFFDLVWPGVCLIEMKASSERDRLAQHRVQALGYWEKAANFEQGVQAPEYVIICAFQRFEIWQPGRFPGKPRISFDLAELPDRFESLLFLLGDEPLFDATVPRSRSRPLASSLSCSRASPSAQAGRAGRAAPVRPSVHLVHVRRGSRRDSQPGVHADRPRPDREPAPLHS